MNPLGDPLRRREDIDEDPVISGSLAYAMEAGDADNRYGHAAFTMAAIISPRLDPVVAANTVGHMLVALGARTGTRILGKARKDADGLEHARLSKYPLIVLTARPAMIETILEQARELIWVTTIDYPGEGYVMARDEYGEATFEESGNNLTYIGAALFGPDEAVRYLCGQLSLWRPEGMTKR